MADTRPALREEFTTALKASMKAGDSARTSTLRMISARLKDVEIAARTRPDSAVTEVEITSMLRGMIKSRRESVTMYRQGNRPELADKELAEIAVIESFLPPEMDGAALEQAVDEAVATTGASSVKDMGKVMAALKARFGAGLDMGRANPLVKARLTNA